MTSSSRTIPRRTGITYKIFIATSLLLFLTAAIIYSTLYLYQPIFYEKYKKNQLDKEVQRLVSDVRGLTFEEAKGRIAAFAQANNAAPTLKDDQGELVYPFAFVFPDTIAPSIPPPSPITILLDSRAANVSNPIIVNTPIVFKDRTLQLTVNATLQPIDEASNVLLMLAPYVGLFVLVVSIVGAYGYSRIVSRMTRTMADLQTANAQLKRDIEREREIEFRRREFFGIISHELKSPITAVKGQLDGMIHEIGIFKDRDTYLRRSYQIMDEMESLVREILQMSKTEHQVLAPNPVPVDLSALVAGIVDQLGFLANEKHVGMSSEIDPGITAVTDPKLVEKALKNVVQNAIEYTNPSEQVIVKLRRTDQGTINFQSLNTGAYIPEELLGKIFEPFYRLEKSRNRNTGGSGLGLHIVKSALDALSVAFMMRNTNQGVLFEAEFQDNFMQTPH